MYVGFFNSRPDLIATGVRVVPWELADIRDQLPHLLIGRALFVAPPGHAGHPHAVRDHVTLLASLPS